MTKVKVGADSRSAWFSGEGKLSTSNPSSDRAGVVRGDVWADEMGEEEDDMREEVERSMVVMSTTNNDNNNNNEERRQWDRRFVVTLSVYLDKCGYKRRMGVVVGDDLQIPWTEGPRKIHT